MGPRPSIQSWMSGSRQPTARVCSPPRLIGAGNDLSRARSQIVALLNPVSSVTSAIRPLVCFGEATSDVPEGFRTPVAHPPHRGRVSP